MAYKVQDRLAFKIPTPVRENKYGPKHHGKYGGQNTRIGLVTEVLEGERYQIRADDGTEHTVPEADLLGLEGEAYRRK
jgi:uncharacterized protein YhaN